MKLSAAIDLYVADMRSAGRINSDATERGYRAVPYPHAEDVGNREPRVTGREDVKRTLARRPHPNAQRKARSILVSFYDRAMEEGIRRDNPARQTRRPKRRPTAVYRLTRADVAAMLEISSGKVREQRVIYLGICAGLRLAELLGMQGRHFRRPGYVWVSADVAKGGRERWVPVIAELEPVWQDIARTVLRDSGRALARSAVQHGSPRAHIARYVGMRNAQFLLGHAAVGTTETYVGRPSLDDLAASLKGCSFGIETRTYVLPPQNRPEISDKATTGIEPVYTALQAAA